MSRARARHLTLVFILALASSCGGSEIATEATPPTGGDRYAIIEVRDFGTIKFAFLEDKAPETVENFRKLARQGFYDGTTFHRVIPGFMIQGGDPNSKDDNPLNDGTGGPGYNIKAEFNDTKHQRGVVSMARSRNPDSAGSQFFIVVADSPNLDGQYTAFGRVVAGMEVADEIVAVERGRGDRPIRDVRMEKVTIE